MTMNLQSYKQFLTCISWNIEGLGNKLKDQTIATMITPYDIVTLQETHTSIKNEDSLYTSLDGFVSIIKHSSKHSQAKGGRGSGGLMFLCKEYLYPFVKETKSNNSYTSWIKLSKEAFGWGKDLFICSAYIPPVESSYFADHFDQLEQEISRFSLTGEVIIMAIQTDEHPISRILLKTTAINIFPYHMITN